MEKSWRLEHLHVIFEQIYLCKYIRDQFKPLSYKGTIYDNDHMVIDDFEDMYHPESIQTIAEILFNEVGIYFELVSLDDLGATQDEYDEVEAMYEEGYIISYMARIPLLQDIFDEDPDVYDQLVDQITTVNHDGYESLIEAFVGGETQLEALNGEDKRDILIFGERFIETRFDFIKDFIDNFLKGMSLYKAEFEDRMDERLSFLLNIPKEELYG